MRKSTQAGLTAVAVCSFTISLLGLAAPAMASSDAEVATNNGPVAVQGVVKDLSGQAVGSGQPISLYAWPSQATMSKLQVGDAVPMTLVGTAVTASNGSFELRYSNPSALAGLADTHGVVNLLVQSSANGLQSDYNVSQAASLTASGPSAEAAAVLPSSLPNVTLQPLPGTSAVTQNAMASPDDDPGCQSEVYKRYGSRQVQVGEGYTTTGAKASFTYEKGSSSDLGVGISTGAEGTFSADGSESNSSTVTESETPHSGSGGVKWRTEFVYSEIRTICTGVARYYDEATSFAGGASYISSTAPSVSSSNCVSQSAGSSYTKDSSTAYTFGAGASTSDDIGINLTAKTGWSTDSKLVFSFTKTLHLCGSEGLPGGSPHRLVAK